MTRGDVVTVAQKPRAPGRHHSWWLLLLLVVSIPAVIVGTGFSDKMQQMLPETLPFPSTYNRKGSGYSALMELCRKVGIKTTRWEGPYRGLSKQKLRGTLVVALPWENLNQNDIDNVLTWVAAGNDLVYFDYFAYRSGSKLLNKLNLETVSRSTKEKVYPINGMVPEAAYAPQLMLSSEVELTGPGEFVIGENKAAGTPLIIVKHGKGRCLIGTMPEFCSNKFIENPAYKGNFQFMVNWLTSSKQPIFFDEKCHGYSAGSNVFFYVLRSPVGFVILQLIILGLVALLSLNQRFGRPRSVGGARKISNLEFIEGMASTYQRARARDTAWAMMFNPLKGRLCKTLGIAADAPVSELAAAWSESAGKPEAECRAFLEKAQNALERRSLSDEELKELVAKSDELIGDSRELMPVRRFMGA